MTEDTGQARMDQLLRMALQRGASDLHFAVGRAPTMRLGPTLEAIRFRQLTAEDFEVFLSEIAPPDVWAMFEERGRVEFSHDVPNLARFRVVLYRQSLGAAAVFHVVPHDVPSMRTLGVPPIAEELAHLRDGLVLVTGPAHSGRSTTVAWLARALASSCARHIIALERSVEFQLDLPGSSVSQRELDIRGSHLAEAVASAVREGPDVLIVDDFSDKEAIGHALRLADEGGLVVAVMHSPSIGHAVEHLVSLFAGEAQGLIRTLVADTFRGGIAQQLLPRLGGGAIAAFEVLLANAVIGNLVREGKYLQISKAIYAAREQGMHEMDESMRALLREGAVTAEDVYERAVDRREMRHRLFNEMGVRTGDEEDEQLLRQLGAGG